MERCRDKLLQKFNNKKYRTLKKPKCTLQHPRDKSQQQHHQPALRESKVQLVQGTDTRIPWEAAFQDKGLWHSWLVFQDSFLKLKTGPFQFTGKWATVSGCSGNFWLSPNKKRKCSKGENRIEQSKQTDEQHIWRMKKVKSCLKLKLSLYLKSPFFTDRFFSLRFPDNHAQARDWGGRWGNNIIHSRGRLRQGPLKQNAQLPDPDSVLPRVLSRLFSISLRDHSDQRSSLGLQKGKKKIFFKQRVQKDTWNCRSVLSL